MNPLQMAPKKKGGGKKGKSAGKPEWMSQELYDLTQNLAKLQEFWCGEVKESKGKGKDGQPLPDPPNIKKEQAGRYMWAILFPNNKAAMERREECIKLAVCETSIKVLAAGKPEEMTPALGILSTLAENLDQARQIMLDNRPSALPHLLKAFATDSASVKAAASSLFRVLSVKEDSRVRLWKAIKEWEWGPLISCLQMQDRSQLGGRNAAVDVMTAISALCNAPEAPIAEGACSAVMASGGLEIMVALLNDRVSHPMTRAGVMSVMSAVMRRSPSALSESVMLGMGALKPLIAMFDHPIIPLINKADAAACLLRFIMPDSLWRNAATLPGGKGVFKAAPKGTDAATDATAQQDIKAAVSQNLEAEGDGRDSDPVVPDSMLMDEATKAEVMRRARIIAKMGAIRPLMALCNGPEGPLPDLEAKAAIEAEEPEVAGGEDGKKKKKEKKKGKKKGKLEPGMAEAQTFGSAVLRLISLDEEWRIPVAKAGVVRYVLPLLDAKLGPARWNSRQLLVNLSLEPSLVPMLQLYKVPNYVHGGNIPSSHFASMHISSTAGELEAIPLGRLTAAAGTLRADNEASESATASTATLAAPPSPQRPPLSGREAATPIGKPPALAVN